MLNFTNEYKKNLVIVSGITRAGKAALCPVVSSFKNYEMFFTSTIAENIIYLLTLKKISPDYAKFILHNIFNEQIYNFMVGRNLNLRKYDYTSVINHSFYKEYLKRSKTYFFSNSSEEKHIKKKFFPIMFHDAMIQSDFLFKNFKGLKIINLIRHPVDLIFSWKKKGYYGKIYKMKRNVVPNIIRKNKDLPFYAVFNKKNFIKTKNKYEKIILMLQNLDVLTKKNKIYKKKSKSFLEIRFDDLKSKPQKTIKILTNFLNTKQTNFTKNLSNQLVQSHEAERKHKKNIIFKDLNIKYKKILNKMIIDYEKKN